MFRLFRKKRQLATAHPLQEKVAGYFVTKILWLQGRWASFMNDRVNRLPVRLKKIAVFIFTALSLLICVSIVIETFTKPYSERSLSVGNIRKGKYSTSINEADVAAAIPAPQYLRVVAFHHYMDSLKGSVSGRKIFDSITTYRPGLLDSAITLEKLYHQQNK